MQGKPDLSISTWLQYVLDNFATVAEAVEALRAEPFNVLAPALPNGSPRPCISLSDRPAIRRSSSMSTASS